MSWIKHHFGVVNTFYKCQIPQILLMGMKHPEGTSKNSDNCDFLKVSDIVKSIVVNGEKYILNDTAQFREDPMEIYI